MVRTDGRTDRRTDTEGYNIIPRHTLVAGYKNDSLQSQRYLVSINSYINLVKICAFVLKILSGNEILEYIKGHYSDTNVLKMMCNNPDIDLVNMNAYIKFGEILSICSKDIEQKKNFGINQGP